jgi:hypothetical protein
MGADSVGVLGFGKEHHGRDVLNFQMRVDLGSWHSTAELLPLTLTAKNADICSAMSSVRSSSSIVEVE